jgi:hypothetical protein
MHWDFSSFENFVNDKKPDGVIPCYKGFHPHSLLSKNYAYIREKKSLIYDIQEKQPYTNNHNEEYASVGIYYFKSGSILKKYAKLLINDASLKINNEFYVSLVFKKIIEDNKKVFNYPIKYFLQWGTPSDLSDYIYYSDAIKLFKKKFISPKIKNNTNLVPMAGLSKRFKIEGYKKSKFLLKVGKSFMYEESFSNLPNSKANVIVKHKSDNINSDNFLFVNLDKHTDGQLSTCLMSENYINPEHILTIGVSDASAVYSENELLNLYKFDEHEVIIWGIDNYPWSKYIPHDFSWIKLANNGYVDKISLKKPLTQECKGFIVSGIFSFKSAKFFFNNAKEFKKKNEYHNGEIYIDQFINYLISLNYKARVLPITSFFGWGTPKEYKTFNYWLKYSNL